MLNREEWVLDLKNAIEYTKEEADDLLNSKKSDFCNGALFGIRVALDHIKNAFFVYGDDFIKYLGLDFDIPKTYCDEN